jgi:hypothetical protein
MFFCPVWLNRFANGGQPEIIVCTDSQPCRRQGNRLTPAFVSGMMKKQEQV